MKFNIVIKSFLSFLVIMFSCYLITTGAGMMNKSSDVSVLIGFVIIFAAIVTLFLGIKKIFSKQNNLTNKKEG